MFGCKHKYGLIKDGYQYCEKCGKAASAPVVQCQHKWKMIEQREKTNSISQKIVSIVCILQCEKCGEISHEVIE